jgi:Surfeit locus protein 5 subunit 22 of Mediator complex
VGLSRGCFRLSQLGLRSDTDSDIRIPTTRQDNMASAQSTSQPTVVRSAKLASQVSVSANVLLDRFSDILEVAATNNKDKYITAAETYQIDVHASAIVRAAEELIDVAQKLKQLWILSETKEEGRELNDGLDRRLQIGDVAQELQRILRKDDSGDKMEEVEV